MIKQTIEDYKKPVPPKWRKVGDYALVVQMFITANIPNFPLTETHKLWVAMAVNFIGVTIKFWANTQKEDEISNKTPSDSN